MSKKIFKRGYYSYSPRVGHDLNYDPVNMITGPRPIGWISTTDILGNTNLAPYSICNPISYKPHILAFSVLENNKTLKNIKEIGDFAWNMIPVCMSQQMMQTCNLSHKNISGFDAAKLTPNPSMLISAPHVLESPAILECKTIEIIKVKDLNGAYTLSNLILAEVVAGHICQSILNHNGVDIGKAGYFLSAGGDNDYCEINQSLNFKIFRDD